MARCHGLSSVHTVWTPPERHAHTQASHPVVVTVSRRQVLSVETDAVSAKCASPHERRCRHAVGRSGNSQTPLKLKDFKLRSCQELAGSSAALGGSALSVYSGEPAQAEPWPASLRGPCPRDGGAEWLSRRRTGDSPLRCRAISRRAEARASAEGRLRQAVPLSPGRERRSVHRCGQRRPRGSPGLQPL